MLLFIYLKPGPSYTHELNGVVERYNRTILDRARCLLSEAKINKKYWPECIYTAAYIGNRLLTNTKINKTPFEIFFNKKPNVSNLHIYGSTAFARINEECRMSKLHCKAVKCILISYTDTGYKILVDNKIIISRHVQFIEKNIRYIKFRGDECPEDPQEDVRDDSSNKNNQEEENKTDQKEEEIVGTKEESIRQKREIKLPKRYNDHVVYVNYTNATVPETYEEAIEGPDSKKWKIAMREELESLENNETWSLVDAPMNKKIIEVKWIYRIKSNCKYKARVVAKGFQ